MRDITVSKPNVNVEALDAALKTAFNTLYKGLSAGNGQVVIHLDDAATNAHVTQAQQIVTNHNPATLTPAQQAEQNRLQALQQARQNADGITLNVADFPLLPQQNLVKKIIMLELELRDLRQRIAQQ